MNNKVIKRDIYGSLKDHVAKKEITLIVGPRQASKTTLMKMLQDELRREGTPTAYMSFDFDRDRGFFASQETFIEKLDNEFGKKPGVAFIDEIQRRQDAGLFLKGIYDRDLPYKLVVSGSGSVELKERVHESLAGRKRVFEVLPLSFREYANDATEYRYDDRLDDFFAVERERTASLMRAYMSYGGYPGVAVEPVASEKHLIMNELFQSYLERDIRALLNVDKSDAFGALLKVIAGQIGNLINYSELSATLGITLPTVKQYLWYADHTFITKRLTPFSDTTRKEITKSPVAYFNDLGMRNFVLGTFGAMQDRDAGFLFQNFVFRILTERLPLASSLHFWRTTDQAEVDFIAVKGETAIPIEVKYRSFADKKPMIERSLRSFIERYHPPRALVINLDREHSEVIGKTEVRFVPVSLFVRSDFDVFAG